MKTWEQRKLKDYLEVSREKNKTESYGKEDVLSVSGEHGIVNQIEFQGRSFAGVSVANYGVVEAGDVVYTKSPLKSNPYGIIKTNKGKTGIVSTLYAVYKPRMNTNSEFVQIYFELDSRMNSYMHPLVNKGAKNDMKVSDENALKGPVAFPELEEQNAITQYFDKLDRLITLHQRKCYRFIDIALDAWEQRKLSDIYASIGNAFVGTATPYYVESGHFYLESNNIKDGQINHNSEIFINDEFYEKQKDKWLHTGDMVMVQSGHVGHAAVIPEELDNSAAHALIMFRHPKEKIEPYFLNYQYQTNKSKKKIEEITTGNTIKHILASDMQEFVVDITNYDEQKKIGSYFQKLDHLITLHQRKCEETKSLKKYMLQKMFPENGNCVPKIRFSGFADAWEQRKWIDVVDISTEMVNPTTGEYDNMPHIAPGNIESFTGRILDNVKTVKEEQLISGKFRFRPDDVVYGKINPQLGKYFYATVNGLTSADAYVFNGKNGLKQKFLFALLQTSDFFKYSVSVSKRSGMPKINRDELNAYSFLMPSEEEQDRIGSYLLQLDHLITLHQHKLFCAKNVMKYITTDINTPKKEAIMAELESVIEQKLIEQLIYGDSQWTYREDLKTEADLWKNFRYILEQNNKERLNGEPLSDAEFEQVKNQLQFSSFYKAGEWLVGENGKVMVHVQRDTERLHLVVMNHEHIAGGSSVYEVINQYNALKMDEDSSVNARDRRFDVTLMINGLPMIHIELKNKQHSYMDGFWQIKKYIGEGKFTGIFSAVQMFVISNGVDTKYFSAASDSELNPKFISGWLDKENNAVSDYLVFAKSVLRIPEAHEMIARYTVLDEEAKRLILLRPYQIHAIEAIRDASKTGKSGFVWHTTGSGKTLTSYKATRNLLMDIPAIDKAIFLIDRKDLDTQTTMAFQAYANNDLIDVDETDNVFDLKKKLKSVDRQVIVTTIQKLQRLITRKLQEGTPEYHKIKNLKIAFVVDECHRAVTPGIKREIERFFGNSLWYGFTGTPRFAENPYPQMGDLPRTTQELYGDCLHKYTIQNAIHDNAVLGFQVEHNGPKNKKDETDSNLYVTESHMLKVLEVILNKSYYKLGFQNGKGKTYEGLLTTSSIQLAQKYYDLLKMVKEGKTTLKIDEKIKQVLPDFPKFAITYSVTENEEGSHVNQQKMQESLDDYNKMFGTKYEISQIQGYNGNLNKRLARKDAKYKSRNEQLDLVIVVDRLLTGFDAPCLSTIFIDRPPMGPHDLIQAFSRTNRIYDKNKVYGQIVTFQAPKLFKESVDNAVRLYSAGSTQTALLADWKEVESAFRKSLKALRVSAETPEEVPGMSIKEKKIFVKLFQDFDKFFAQLKSFTQYEDNMLAGYGITEDEYTDYAGQYLNAKEEIKEDTDGQIDDPGVPVVDEDYELMAYSHTKIDYEYIINLIQNIVSPDEESQDVTQEQKQKQMDEVKQYVEELRKDNPKVAEIMTTLIGEIEQDVNKYKGQSILNIVENMKQECIEKVVTDFCITWYTSKDDVMYAAMHYRNGEIPNESAIKETANFTSYKEVQERAIPKFKYYTMMIAELRKTLDEEIKPLMNH